MLELGTYGIQVGCGALIGTSAAKALHEASESPAPAGPFIRSRPFTAAGGAIQPATTRSLTGCNAPSKPLVRASEPSDYAVKPNSSPDAFG